MNNSSNSSKASVIGKDDNYRENAVGWTESELKGYAIKRGSDLKL
jgi:hypothetical protein